ncbi:UDP-glucose dehydrogenase family protein [Virgibacillus halodenitrificans]|uniref:UDP-glucose dehydrogenase family protein n=1 Tax=Virgibacillus halodenitrificans TaxID=1482 RepID=UPI00031C4398|nr:UDP-glucose/GDP-mannose dehydrogenase family protein [Virgibacillus halodenitrificans]MYL56450.1 nucleotide sugar dehydrogenase [Virgibacillus halodenitrificans]
MEIAVIGTGYVGLVTGVCLADIGNKVTCIDVDPDKITMLREGVSPIYEQGLTELLQQNIERGTLDFTTEYNEGIYGKDLIYIAVGTPQGKDGAADLSYIVQASKSIAENLNKDAVIVTKSTVPLGTNDYIKQLIESNLNKSVSVKIASNPEFLRQGTAVYDTYNGDRIVIGADDEEALKVLEEVNSGFNLPIVKTDLRSAEMIKYASNAFLATKISFINEMANLSERIGANIDNVAEGMGMDKRIGQSFLNAGIGYGGSCFPKDTNAIISIGKEVNYSMPILESVVKVNERQRGIIVEKILDRIKDVKGKKVAVLGLAFKPNTDDMREAPSILVTERLIKKGAEISAFDPVAIENAKKVLPKEINYTSSIEETIEDADIAVILTEWQEIKQFPLEDYKLKMKEPIIFDGRNCFTREEAERAMIEYHSIGRPTVIRN